MKRTLGRSGIEVSALGMGCWAIGGPFWDGETPLGWGEVDDEESIRPFMPPWIMGLISSIRPMFMARVIANGCSAAQSPDAGHRL